MTTIFNGREVEIEISFSRCIEDCFVENAWYVDTGEALTADELDVLQEQDRDLIDEAWHERAVGYADYLCDLAQDK